MSVTQPSPESIFDQLTSLDLSQGTLSICFGARKDRLSPTQYERIQITKKLATHFKEKFITSFLKSRAERKYNGDLELYAYDHNAGTHDHEIQHLEIKNFSEISEQLLPLDKIQDVPVFSENKSFMRLINHYVAHIVMPDGTKVQFIRRSGVAPTMTKSNTFFALMAEGQYDLMTQNTISFDSRIDCIVYGDYIFILDDKKFLDVFNLYEPLKKAAKTVLAKVQSHILIDGFEKFSESCLKDTRKCAKLKSILDRNYLSGISFDKIKQTILSHNVPVKIGTDAIGNECLIYDPTKKWAILKLLHDDYVVSKMTGNNYEALNKRSAA